MSALFPREYNPFSRDYWLGRLDSRPIALFRVLFGLVLLKVALYHIPIAERFFSDAGILPRWAMFQGLVRTDRFSVLDSLGQEWMVVAFFAFWAVVALCLTVGYRSRTMAILNFVCILSVHERDPFLLNAADTIMRVVSFWIIFIPLGQTYSVEAVLQRWRRFKGSGLLPTLQAPEQAPTVFAFPARMVQLQIALVYIFTSVLKIPGDLWRNGDAIYYVLQLPTSTLPTGDWLFASSPLWVLQALNYFTLIAEWAFFPLVFCPFGQPTLRILGLTLETALHVGIAFLMSVPNFLVLVVSYLLYFEGRWVEAIDRALRRTRETSVLAPAKGRHPLLAYLALTRPSELTLAAGPAEPYDRFDSWWIEDAHGKRYESAAAWGRLVGHLPLSRFWWWTVKPRSVRRFLWWFTGGLLAAQPTEILSQEPSQLVSGASPIGPKWFRLVPVAALVLALGGLMTLVVWWNLTGVTKPGPGNLVGLLPKAPASVVQHLGLWQAWGMYSPEPKTSDGNIIIPGTFEDGAVLNLATGKPPSDAWRRGMWGPTAQAKMFEDAMAYGNRTPVFQAWGSRLCLDYNDGSRLNGKRLATIDFKWRYRNSHPPGAVENSVQEYQLWHHWCLDQDRPQ